jgi:hypothetical protein
MTPFLLKNTEQLTYSALKNKVFKTIEYLEQTRGTLSEIQVFETAKTRIYKK